MTRNVDVVEIDRGMVSKLDTTGINGNVVVVVRAAATTVMIWNHFHVHIRNKYDSNFQIIVFIALVYCSWMLDVGCWMVYGVWAVLLLLLLLWLGYGCVWCGMVVVRFCFIGFIRCSWHSLQPHSKMRYRNED